MFTGLINHLGRVRSIERIPSGLRLGVSTPFTDVVLGESIAVDGVCLSVTKQVTLGDLCFELSSETLDKTIAGSYQMGELVHLERALLVGQRLGGHFVTGHVDETVPIIACVRDADFCILTLGPFDTSALRLLANKGSIAVNGVSLTVNRVHDHVCECILIPYTLNNTTFGTFAPGYHVNIEYDLLAKIIARQVGEII